MLCQKYLPKVLFEGTQLCLADGTQTEWVSPKKKQIVLEVEFPRTASCNTLVVDEKFTDCGRLQEIQAEYLDGEIWTLWEPRTITDCFRLPARKQIFYPDAQFCKLRLTLTGTSEEGFCLRNLEFGQTLEQEAPLCTSLITLQPDVAPNAQQQRMINLGYSMFLHFGMNTFAEAEWTDGTLPPSRYAPTAIDANQWVRTAYEAGMKTVLLVTKHHDGFCLWDSEFTDYDVGNPTAGSHIDVVQAVSEACNQYGIRMAVYYSCWDRNWDNRHEKNDAAYATYMRNQLTELLGGKYGVKDKNGRGVITELWLDGCWEKTAAQWEMAELYDLVKKLQPSCQVGHNASIGDSNVVDPRGYFPNDWKEGDNICYFPADFRLYDSYHSPDVDPKLYTYRGQTYYLPYEATFTLSKSWFWNTQYGSRAMTAQEIADHYRRYRSQNNVFVLNCGPNRDGRLEQADVDQLREVARILEIAP